MTDKDKIVEKFAEEIWELGKKRKITGGMWGAAILGIQLNVIANFLPPASYTIQMVGKKK